MCKPGQMLWLAAARTRARRCGVTASEGPWTFDGEKKACPSCSMIMLQSIGSCREFLEMPPGQPECSGELPQAKQAACPCRAPVISPKQCFATPWAPRPMERIPKRTKTYRPLFRHVSSHFRVLRQVSARSGPLQSTSGTVVAEASRAVSS